MTTEEWVKYAAIVYVWSKCFDLLGGFVSWCKQIDEENRQ